MNKFYSFILAIFLSLDFCQASSEEEAALNLKEKEEILTNSNSSQGSVSDIPSGGKFLETIEEGIDADVLHCFVFNIGQGNFVVLKFNKNIAIIDCGLKDVTQEKWNAFYEKNENVFNEIFENSTIKAVVVTHPDKDHYNCLEYLFNKIAPAKECIFVVGRNNEADYELLDKKSKKVIYAVEDDQRYNEANGDLTTALFGSADSVGTVEIIEPVYNITTKDINSHSLILKVTYDKQSILFTGDATKNTFKAIYGDAKADDETQKNLSIKNRLALKSINFLIAPHHGASTDESNLWLMHVNKKNPYNFVGVIFCAPDDIQKSSSEEEQPKQNTSLYGHPGNYIDNIHFENTTFAHKLRYHYGAKQYPRTKDSHEPIWVTGLTTHAYWLQLSSETGMQIFNDHDGKFHALLSKDGWSPKMQPIFEDLKKATVPDATWSLLLQEPRKWKCRNGKGQTLSEALYADDSENYKENISKNINTYLEIIKDNEHQLHRYYTSTLTREALLKRYFKFPEEATDKETKALKDEQKEALEKKRSKSSDDAPEAKRKLEE